MVGGWKEVGRTTLSGGSDSTITVSNLPNKRYYMVLDSITGISGSSGVRRRYGNGGIDSGSNYASRFSQNGGNDVTNTSRTFLRDGFGGFVSNDLPIFGVEFISNLQMKEKLNIFQAIHSSDPGAGTAPARWEEAGKWTNTSNVIDNIELFNNTSTYTDAEVVVLGWDPDDTHTDNFWEELANIELDDVADNISTGVIPAKKYLWLQFFKKGSGLARAKMTFNNDTGVNYATRNSEDGVESTSLNRNDINLHTNATGNALFVNAFILNISSNEKLCIAHNVDAGSSGAGNTPNRSEIAGKWTNTSNQITRIDITNDHTGSYGAGTILKVWGHD